MALQVLLTGDAEAKAARMHQVWRQYVGGQLPVGSAVPPPKPARPAKPEVQPPRQHHLRLVFFIEAAAVYTGVLYVYVGTPGFQGLSRRVPIHMF